MKNQAFEYRNSYDFPAEKGGELIPCPLSRVIPEFIEARKAEHYSPRTVDSYQTILNVFSKWLDEDPPINQIGIRLIRKFFSWKGDVSRKTALNYHTALSSLWGWAMANSYCSENVVRIAVRIRKSPQPEVIPFSQADLKQILEAARAGAFPRRDEALVLLMLDTGLRASELCGIMVNDIFWSSRKVRVQGKGDKSRALKFSVRTEKALDDYLASRGITKLEAFIPMFAKSTGKAFTRQTLRKIIDRLSRACGVVGAHAHRFRHTFAIQFLRNGGNIYTLQKLLGHTTLDMVKRYLAIAQTDMDASMDKASPVMGWDL